MATLDPRNIGISLELGMSIVDTGSKRSVVQAPLRFSLPFPT
jgi:hypothetical protein